MKIVCFGDSLTRGVSFVKGRMRIVKNNYPALLEQLFKNNIEHSHQHIEVINKGVFNDNSNLLLERLEKDVIHEKPDYVLIGIGGNDCNFLWDQVSQCPNERHEAIVPLDRYIQNLKTMTMKVRQEGLTPILLTLPPLDPARYYDHISSMFSDQISNWICKVGGIEHWHEMYNRNLHKLAEEINVLKVDVRSALRQAGELVEIISNDGIHLTEKSYKVLATEVFNKMVNLVEKNEGNKAVIGYN